MYLPEYSVTTLDVIHHMDALTLLKALPAQSVDMVLCDPPYGTTSCTWDSVIPFAPMWEGIERVLKPRGACVMTASQPFTSSLVMSNPTWFRHEWIWRKPAGTGYLNANRMPMKNHESVLVFGKNEVRYHPIKVRGESYRATSGAVGGFVRDKSVGGYLTVNDGTRYPMTVQDFKADPIKLHPTQKPVALFEYLIRTYTRPGEVVLDFCMGSGTTAVAARNLDRHFIGCDTSAEYVALARERLRNTDPFQSRVVAPGIEQPSLFEAIP